MDTGYPTPALSEWYSNLNINYLCLTSTPSPSSSSTPSSSSFDLNEIFYNIYHLVNGGEGGGGGAGVVLSNEDFLSLEREVSSLLLYVNFYLEKVANFFLKTLRPEIFNRCSRDRFPPFPRHLHILHLPLPSIPLPYFPNFPHRGPPYSARAVPPECAGGSAPPRAPGERGRPSEWGGAEQCGSCDDGSLF